MKITSTEPHLKYEEALEIAKKYLDPEQIDILKLQLTTHLAAPIIEAHHQYYNQIIVPTITNYDASCEVWAQIGSIQACTIDELEQHLTFIQDSKVEEDQTKLEHVYCRQSCLGIPQINVYTSSFSSEFNAFHQYLLNTIKEHGSFKYSLRFKPSQKQQQKDHHHPLYLSGYGVELTLKNTDYLVIDDRTTKEKSDKEDSSSSSASSSFLKNNQKKGNQALFESNEISKIEPLTQDEIKRKLLLFSFFLFFYFIFREKKKYIYV